MVKKILLSTILRDQPKYEEVDISNYESPNSGVVTTIKQSLAGGPDSAAGVVLHYLELTGLNKALKKYPPEVIIDDGGERFTGAEIENSNTLRVVYDPFPLSYCVPIMKIIPVGNGLWMSEQNLEQAKVKPIKITASIEGVNLTYDFISVFISYKPCDDQELKQYYGDSIYFE